MQHYQLTPRVALTIGTCHPALKWFAGKTNRLALYSANLCGLEFNLYIARNWAYTVLDESPVLIEEAPVATAPSAVPVQSTIVQFRASPAPGIPLPPPAHSNH